MAEVKEHEKKALNLYQYGNIKIGNQTLTDAVLDLDYKTKDDKTKAFGKSAVWKALKDKNVPELRVISDFYYNTNGIYERMCNYLAFLYRYDWYVEPELYVHNKIKADKIIAEFYKILNYLDRSNIKKLCGDIALDTIVQGVYYGYIVESPTQLMIQKLPPEYCRSRYQIQGRPAIEFNMKYFDTEFTEAAYREKILKLFPKEFRKGYAMYKLGKLKPDTVSDGQGGWYLLDPDNSFKFDFNNNSTPIFVNAVPYLLDLEAAQDLDRRKQMQKLLKILVQELPLDKNGDLIFDVDEARDIHNNAVQMLSRAIGVDVLTTFTEVKSIDMADKNTATSTDDLEKVERALFNSFGISQNLFNTDGNMSLDKSILNDEATVRDLILQFDMFFDHVIRRIQKDKKMVFKFHMLETTIYNHKEMSKLYKEQTQLGYSKMLPQIALGHTQSAILNTAYFENEILDLSSIMIPPLMSSTLSGEDLKGLKEDKKEGGRPEKPDDQKSDKTIANKESMS